MGDVFSFIAPVFSVFSGISSIMGAMNAPSPPPPPMPVYTPPPPPRPVAPPPAPSIGDQTQTQASTSTQQELAGAYTNNLTDVTKNSLSGDANDNALVQKPTLLGS